MTYSLFHHQRMLDFFCAVRQDSPVPLFIRAPAWSYFGTIAPDTPRPPGFDEDAALFACRFQGFYAFRAQSRWAKLRGIIPDRQGRNGAKGELPRHHSAPSDADAGAHSEHGS